LENKIGYIFKNKSLLKTALTRRSYAVEKNISEYNQRLEFLGDSILGLTIAEELYKKYPNLKEGELTKIKASIVCEKSLSIVANELEIPSYLYIGKGEKLLGVDNLDSTTSDTLEAIFAAVYLDSDFDTAKKIILKLMAKEIKEAMKNRLVLDYKSTLQEEIQKKSNEDLVYTLIEETGPEHSKKFISQVSHNNKILGKGEGKTKKESEKIAAYNALKKLKLL
jgi:ribonuclease-3